VTGNYDLEAWGWDTLDFSLFGSSISIDLSYTGWQQVSPGLWLRTDGYFSNVIGTAGNDRIWGNNWNNIIDGGGGNDILIGSGGGDDLYGGAGNDFIVGGQLSYCNVDYLPPYNSAGCAPADTSFDYLRGQDGNDVLIGGNYVRCLTATCWTAAFDGFDSLDGGAGVVDTMVGGNLYECTVVAGCSIFQDYPSISDTNDNISDWDASWSTGGINDVDIVYGDNVVANNSFGSTNGQLNGPTARHSSGADNIDIWDADTNDWVSVGPGDSCTADWNVPCTNGGGN
jgi:hypothetical protein